MVTTNFEPCRAQHWGAAILNELLIEPSAPVDLAGIARGIVPALPDRAVIDALGQGAAIKLTSSQAAAIQGARALLEQLAQARQSSAAAVGQRTLRCSEPRRSSTWICCSAVGDGVGPVRSADGAVAGLGGAGIPSATNSGAAVPSCDACTLGGLGALAADGAVTTTLAGLAPRPARHWRTRFAFSPCASATPEIDAPGSSQSARTLALNSAP